MLIRLGPSMRNFGRRGITGGPMSLTRTWSFRIWSIRRRSEDQTQISAMHLTHLTHLTHLHMTTMASSPVGMRHRLKNGEARKQGLHSQHNQTQDEEKESKLQRWPYAIPNLLHVPEKRRRFRSRNVISLNDADRICLICHDDLCRRGGTIWELHSSHNFHSECIQEWLWMKQTCPICHKRMAMPEPLY
ncbi:hypothetical protein AMELA_G00167460 [Ameiurus melas]|uniref:RING-type domain-containing protein n=1 Tax=Ameiurus melas TaxID=219545 RepID=A0A7J6ADN8_AMEME|nr:hypothetical protein AMELA_G00167460 [Ameiurus melas]